jgi:hypothetical protein
VGIRERVLGSEGDRNVGRGKRKEVGAKPRRVFNAYSAISAIECEQVIEKLRNHFQDRSIASDGPV